MVNRHRAVDIIFAGPPEYEADDAWSPDEEAEQWANGRLRVARGLTKTFPECAVAVAARHRDENSPHVHVTMVPIVDGALGWGKVQNKVTAQEAGASTKSRTYQMAPRKTSYHAAIGEKYGAAKGGITDPDRKHKPITGRDHAPKPNRTGLKAADARNCEPPGSCNGNNEEAERQLNAVADQLEDMGQPYRADVIRRATELPERKLEIMVQRLDARMGQKAKEVFTKELARARERHDERMAKMREQEQAFMDAFEARATELKEQIAGWEAIARKKPLGYGRPLAHAGG